MLGAIRAITTTVPDIAVIEESYSRFLGYRTVQHGVVSPATAQSWGAPGVAGNRLLVMMPESGDETYLRFVEQPMPSGFKPLTSYGWNATEILVQNPYGLAKRLAGSPFRIIGPPHELDGLPGIVAMQVIGPAQEILYFTYKTPVAGADTPLARSFVDYCFIAVMGGPDMNAMLAFYRNTFGNPPGNVAQIPITVLSDANGLAQDTRYPLATILLEGPKKLEVDQYPPSATKRPRPPGGLAPGMAIVTFAHGRLDRLSHKGFRPPRSSDMPPFTDHRTIAFAGAAGELIELVEI
jgi:hypothetical protein